jgi:hypothetical protein
MPAPLSAMLGFDIVAFTAGSKRIAGVAEGVRIPRQAGRYSRRQKCSSPIESRASLRW